MDWSRQIASTKRRVGLTIASALAVLAAAVTTTLVRDPRVANALATLRVRGQQIDVALAAPSRPRVGHTGQRLTVGNLLRTNSSGFGEVNYFDGSLTRLDYDSSFTVERLTSRPDRRIRVHLEVGGAWNQVQKLSGKESFELSTPVATAAVRGTTFVVWCNPLPECTFLVLEGSVLVTTTSGERILLSAVEQVTIGPDRAVRAPTRPSEGDVSAIDFVRRNRVVDGTLAVAPEPSGTPATPPAIAAPATAPTAASAAPVVSRTPRPTRPPTAPPVGDPELHDLFVVNADGSGETRLTNTPTLVEEFPSWSPDGSKVAFRLRDPGPNATAIVVMNADGSGQTTLATVTPGLFVDNPSWSPDGTRIVFSKQRQDYHAEIWSMKADGTNQRPLTSGDASLEDTDPAWSPDGTRIAFAREVDGGGSTSDIWAMNADGTNQRTVTTDALHATWSPDGTRIAFAGTSGTTTQGILVMNADGSARTVVAATSLTERSPSWSLSGRIVFVRTNSS